MKVKEKIIGLVLGLTMISACMPIMASAGGIDFNYWPESDGICITRYTGSDTDVTVPSKIEGISVTKIDAHAFEGNYSIKNVTLPDSIKAIGDHSFEGCTGLESIILPDSITSIGEHVFDNDRSLVSITLSNSLETIPYCAFWGCTKLTKVNMPDSIKSIDNYAFYDCTALTIDSLPASLESIGNSAFDSCEQLKNITIPDSVKRIGSGAFSGCSLNDITISNKDTVIGDGAFEFVPKTCMAYVPEGFDKYAMIDTGNYQGKFADEPDPEINFEYTIEDNEICLTKYTGFSTNVTIPSELEGLPVTKIGDSAFENCDQIVRVIIPDSVNSIGARAFYSASRLTEVNIPTSLTEISDETFAYTKVKFIVIPENVTAIGTKAFQNSSLEYMEIKNKDTTVGDSAFDGIPDYCGALVFAGFDKDAMVNVGKYPGEFDEIVAISHTNKMPSIQAKKSDDNSSATMRFAWEVESGVENIGVLGAFIVPFSIFEDSSLDDIFDDMQMVYYNFPKIKTGDTFSADLTNIPSQAFGKSIIALPFVNGDIKEALSLTGTVDEYDINK